MGTLLPDRRGACDVSRTFLPRIRIEEKRQIVPTILTGSFFGIYEMLCLALSHAPFTTVRWE